MYEGTESIKSRACGVLGGIGISAAAQSNQIKPRDVSPIEQQIQRQSQLLEELHVVTHSLIDSIKPVMRYDPREAPQPAGKETSPCSGCALEQELEVRNNMLAEKISLLSQAREVICL